MFDPTQVPDVLPLTQVPWADAVLKVIGAVSIILTVLANTLPKLSPLTLILAKLVADFRGVVPNAAAKAEAIAQSQGMTTVPKNVLPSDLPMATKEALKAPPTP